MAKIKVHKHAITTHFISARYSKKFFAPPGAQTAKMATPKHINTTLSRPTTAKKMNPESKRKGGYMSVKAYRPSAPAAPT